MTSHFVQSILYTLSYCCFLCTTHDWTKWCIQI